MAPLQSLMSELEKDKHHRFPNLAVTKCLYDHEGEPLRNEKVFKETDDAVCAELAAAGLEKESIFQNDALRYSGKGRYFEVPASVVGLPHRWQLRRAWGYWIATGPGIPPEHAIPFDEEWGKEVRVTGDCACRGAEFWGQGFAIGVYHIDTQEGLSAFVKLLEKVHRPR